ncbi:MAG: hypothetical protein KKA79_08225 [Nanoarchaeota archaeon]|nr:hypothetical protein [Nanoarchaeota archaeon]MCG2718627.1 hypothetical protein [Nanoarchaeota archaeon]
MAIDLKGGIEQLESMGFYEIVLPFLLVFTLVFAVLEKAKLFGAASRKFNAIIALVVGLLIVRQGTIVEFINIYLPNVSAVIIVFLGFLIIMGLFGVGHSAFKGAFMFFLVVLAVGGGIWALTQAADTTIELPWLDFEFSISDSDAGALIVIGMVLLVLMVAVGYKPQQGGVKKLFKTMSEAGDAFAGKRIDE